MPIHYDTLINWPVPVAKQAYTRRDTILYALGLGLGTTDADLDFVYEKSLKALPTMGAVMGTPGAWFKEPGVGIDYLKLVNAGVSVVFHKPMPVEGSVTGKTKITKIVDKGAGRGALVVALRHLYDDATDELLCAVESNYLCRGDGGFGGKDENTPVPHTLPERAPDKTVEFQTSSRAALIYRLSGDLNPLHIDPDVAAKAGFQRPILHGLCTYGIAGYVAMKHFGDSDPARLLSFGARFSLPVTPGDTLHIDMWRDGGIISLQGRTPRGVVLGNGRAEIKG